MRGEAGRDERAKRGEKIPPMLGGAREGGDEERGRWRERRK